MLYQLSYTPSGEHAVCPKRALLASLSFSFSPLPTKKGRPIGAAFVLSGVSAGLTS